MKIIKLGFLASGKNEKIFFSFGRMTSLLFTVHYIHKNFISDILMMSNIHNTYWHNKHYCIYFKFLREIGLASLFQLLILSDDLLFNTKNNWLSCIGIFGVKAPNFFRQSTVSLHRYKINAATQKKNWWS